MEDIIYLFIGYTVIWLGLFLYVIYLHQKQAKLSRDIDLIEEMVKSYGKKQKGKRKK